MKKKVLIIPLLMLGVGTCFGCANNESSSVYSSINKTPTSSEKSKIEETEKSNEIKNDDYSNLENFRLKNINKFTAIGVGSFDKNSYTKNKSNLKKMNQSLEEAKYVSNYVPKINDEDSLYFSNEPFSLIGQLANGSIEELSFDNDIDSTNLEIQQYYDWGDYINFVPGSNFYEMSEENSSSSVLKDGEDPSKSHYHLRISSSLLTKLNDNIFTFSKKTGKVYKAISLNQLVNDFYSVDYISKVAKDGSTFVVNKDKVLKVYENERGLNFKYLGQHDQISIDNYGNILVESGIITASDSKLHKFNTYLDGDLLVKFNRVNGEIYASSNDRMKAYVFNENEEFVEVPMSGQYLYETSYQNGKDVKVNLNDQKTWDISILLDWLEYKKDLISNKDELIKNDFKTITREQFLEAYWLSCIRNGWVIHVIMSEDGDILAGWDFDARTNFNYSKYPPLYESDDGVLFLYASHNGTIYKRLSEHAFEFQPLLSDYNNYGNFYSTLIVAKDSDKVIKRGNYLYSLSDKGVVFRYSFEQNKIENLNFDGYDIKAMEIRKGKIVLAGTDDSFNEFEGFLDSDDQISFEQTKSSDVIVLTPIN